MKSDKEQMQFINKMVAASCRGGATFFLLQKLG
jgi:hypothetical protein